MANNRLVVQSGQSAGAIIGTYDIFGTNNGNETVTVFDGTIANFQGDFSRGGDTIKLTDIATDFTVAITGSNAILTSVSDGITVIIPIGTVGTKIVFENAAGQLVDERVLIFNGANVLLGGQTVTGTPTQLTNTGGGNSTNTIVLTAGLDTAPGGTADDTFLGFNTTLNAGDALDGGAGFNTLKVATDGSLTVQNYGGFTTVNIQRIELTNDDAQAVSMDLSGTQGVQVVAATNSSQDIAFNQLTTLAKVELNNVTNPAIGGPDVTVQYQDSLVAGAATSVDVVIKTSKSDNLTLGSVSDANGGIETVNISVVEGASTLDTLDSDLTNLNISGDKDFAIDDALNDTVRNIDATALNAALDIDFSDNDGAGEGVIFKGAKGANTVLAGSASDDITTYDGDDVITTDDSIGFFDGDDTVNAGNGNNTVTSGVGNDSITSGSGNDVINANNGNNIVDAGNGANNVTTGNGNDTITTGTGADTISSGDGLDTISSGAGADFITIGDGQHSIASGDGNDTVVAGNEFDARTLAGPDIQDQIDFGAGDADELRIGAISNNTAGNGATGAGADLFQNVADGTLEVLTFTNAGNSNLNAVGLLVNEADAAGIVVINTDFGYEGNDSVNAGTFDNNLTWNIGLTNTAAPSPRNGGNDTIVSGIGNDTINMLGDNNLTDSATPGALGAGDSIVGGLGTDTLNLDGDTTLGLTSRFSGIEVINLDDQENDTVSGGANTYDIAIDNDNAPDANGTITINGAVLQADEGAKISTLAVTAFSASIVGGAGADTIISGIKSDTIKTGAGNDTVDVGQAPDFGGLDNIDLGTGDDTLIAGRNLSQSDVNVGGDGIDTLIVGGIDTNDIDFTNTTEFEILQVGEGFNNTLAKEAQEAGFTTIVSAAGTTGTVIDASGFTKGVVIDISATTGGGANNDVVKAGSGNDTVIAGVGNQNVDLGAGDDEIWVNGSEFDINDTLAGGDGNDTVVLDNTGSDAVNPVNAVVNLDTVTGIENFVIKADGDRNVGTDADANTITFANGDVGTLTNINVDASKLTDPADSLKVTLAASLDDDDYMFTITGSSTQTIVEKLNLGVDNNVSFTGGTGVDTLIIHGGDLGSTISMDGGAGQDVISQTGGKLTDDGFVNISNVEVLTGFTPGTINAVLGAEADQAGIIFIDDTTGSDTLSLDAAFNNDLTVDLEGGNDNYSALKSASKVTFIANGSVTASDTLVGGTGVNDAIEIGAETAVLNGMTKVENVNVVNEAISQSTIISTNQNAGNLSVGATFLKVDASTLDSSDTLTFTQTGSQAISLEGGAGADTVSTAGGNDIINAGDGADVINAGDGANTVNAGAGNDSVTTGSGNDSITGGTGNDTIFSNGGNDTIDAGDGNDQISSGSGVDTITTGAGLDQVFGGTGGDTINLTADAQKDSVFYTQRMDSSTSSDRDTITGFESGTDIIDVRYVAELLTGGKYTLGNAKLEFLGNYSEFGGAQGALTSATPGNVGIVFQQNTNTLWVDLNDDNILNGDDLQIVLNGTSSVKAEDVLSGTFVGFTPVPSGAPGTVGTIIDERFVLTGPSAVNGPWTLDGGLGNDVLVLGNQNISTSTITNVEAVEITNNSTALMTIAQHNFFESKNGFVNTGTNQTLSIVDSGVFTGTAGLGVDKYILSSDLLISNVHNDFTLGAAGQDVQGGDDWDVIRTGALDTLGELTGVVIDGGVGQDAVSHTVEGISVLGDVLVLDAGDDISGATISGIESSIITQSSVTMTAAQYGAAGLGGVGTIGKIYDAGDVGANSTDTITISTQSNITGHADIENYVLGRSTDAFDDVFTVLGAKAGVNVSSAAGNDTINVNNLTITGNYALDGAGDTFKFTGSSSIVGVNGGNATTAEAFDLTTAGSVSVILTEAQHDAVGAANITGAGADDEIYLQNFDIPNPPINAPLPGDDGSVTGSATIASYYLNGIFDFTLGANFQDAIGDNANNQTVRVNGFTLTAASTLSGGTGGSDTLVLNASDISLASVSGFETIQISTTGTLTEAQYEAATNITGAGNDDTVTLSTANGSITPGVVTGDADIENYVLNDAFTFNVVALTGDTGGKSTQDVTGDLDGGSDAQTINITNLDYRGTIDGNLGNDTVNLSGTALLVADISQAAGINDIETTTVDGFTKMTLTQHNGTVGNVVGTAGTDQITLVGAGTLTGKAQVENYVLANTGANDFSVVADTRSVRVAPNANPALGHNDTVRLDGTTFTTQPFELDLDANAGGAGDLLVVDGNIDISNINTGLETTAETLKITTDVKITQMTVAQHEGFTASISAAGINDTVKLTTGGLVNAEAEVENYDLSPAANTLVVSQLNGAVNIADTDIGGDNDRIVVGNNVVATGTWNLSNLQDTVEASGTADIQGVNLGTATTAENLELSGLINELTLTRIQHEAFTGSKATAGADTLVIIGAGTVTALDNVENYNTSNASNTVIVNANETGVNVKDTTVANGTTINVGGLTVTGNYALAGAFLGGEDTIVMTNGANISGVNGGGATTAENANITGDVTMTVAQHEGFLDDTLILGTNFVATGVNTITLTTVGTIDARSQVEAYVLAAAGGSTININSFLLDPDSNPNVSIKGVGGVDTITVDDSIVLGGKWELDGLGDILIVGDDVDLRGVNNGAVTTIEVVQLGDDGDDLLMTSAQHNGFSSVTSPTGAASNNGNTNTFTVTNTGTGVDTIVGFVGIDAYVLTATTTGTFDFSIGATGQDVSGTGGDDIIRSTALVDDLTGSKINGGGGNDTLVLDNGDNITGATLTSMELLSVSGTVTMTGDQYDSFATVNVSGTGAADEIVITTIGVTPPLVAADTVETYTAAHTSGMIQIDFNGSDAVRAAQTFNSSTTNTGSIGINAGTVDQFGSVDASLTVNLFSTGGPADTFRISHSGGAITGATDFINVNAASNADLSGELANGVIVINGLAATDLTKIGNGQDVENAISNAVQQISAGVHLFVLENAGLSGESGLYLVNVQGVAATNNLDGTNFDVEFIGFVDHQGFAADFVAGNFV